jgi:hypothetical protein
MRLMPELQQFDTHDARPRTPRPAPTIMTATNISITQEETMEKVGELVKIT